MRRPTEFHFYDWYFNRWFGSETRARCRALPNDYPMGLLANAAEGAYRNLLDYCYQEGDIPSDISGLAALCGMAPEVFEVIWPAFRSKFVAHKSKPGRLTHEEVLIRRRAWKLKKKQQADAGGKSAQKRRINNDSENNNIGNDPATKVNGRSTSVPQEVRSKNKEVRSKKEEESAEREPRFPPLDPPPNEFDYQTGFKELWDAYPPKGRTKIIDTQRVYVETVSPDPERIHRALIAAVLPGGKWASSENWVRGFVCSLFEYIRNRRDLEDPEPFKPGREPTANGRLTAIERSRKSLEEVDLSDVEKAY